MAIYVHSGNQQAGPLEEEQVLASLRSGVYSAEDLAWREGMVAWQPLRVLFPAAVSTPPPLQLPVAPRIGDDVGMRLLLPVGRSLWAIAAGYLGLFALIILPAPLALVVSIIAIWDIQKSRSASQPKYGMGRAVFGLITGLLGTAFLVFLLLSRSSH